MNKHCYAKPLAYLYNALRKECRRNCGNPRLVCVTGGLLLVFSLAAQTTSQTSFGKNRVQYHRQQEDWLLYESANFVTYWYGDARNVAQAALQTAEYDFDQIQQALEYQPTEKIEILVFQDLTDLKQSNIGEGDLFQTGRSNANAVKKKSDGWMERLYPDYVSDLRTVGNKVFVHFDGNHQHLRAQVRQGVAQAVINSMLYGANLQEIVQNAVLLNLPGWYTDGLTVYCGEDWNPQLDNQLRDLLLSGNFKTFDKLARQYPRLAGHAFWHYIALQFGRGTISNLLYLTRINRSIDAGFLYVLGSGYKRTAEAMMEYYLKRYREDEKYAVKPEKSGKINIQNKRNLPLSQLRISPDGRQAAWVSNDLGRWRVYVQDLRGNGRRKTVLKGGARNALQATDYNYPLLAWNPNNQQLAVLYERRDVPKLALIELATGKKELSDLSPEYQRVFSMDFTNPQELLLSAAVRGYSDLFLYRLVTRQTERLTQDLWDDLDATVVTLDGRKSVLFASNRLTDTLSPQKLDTVLPIGRFDIFLFDLESRSPELVRVTQTPFIDEHMPFAVDSAHMVYLSDENGTVNRQGAYLEPYLAYHYASVYLKDGAEVKAAALKPGDEWPLERVLSFMAPLDTLLKNIDSTQIDSIRIFPVYKKRPTNYNLTNYNRNILYQHAGARAGRLLEAISSEGKIHFYKREPQAETITPAPATRFREMTLHAAGLPVPPRPALENTGAAPVIMKNEPEHSPTEGAVVRSDTSRAVQPGWLFQVPEHLKQSGVKPVVIDMETPTRDNNRRVEEVRFEPLNPDSMRLAPPRRPGVGSRTLSDLSPKKEVIRFNTSQIIPYRLRFRTDYMTITPNNDLLFEGLEDFDRTGQGYNAPRMGLLMKANFKDLLENYVLEAGARVPVNLNGAEYYVWLDNKKHRLDRRITLYRRTNSESLDGVVTNPSQLPRRIQNRRTTLLGQYEVRYPLDAFFSLRATGTVRQDRIDSLSTDRIALESSPRTNQRVGLRLSAVYDNTVDVDLNLKTGTRAKLYIESIKRFAFNTRPEWSLKFNEGFMTLVGLDARHYQPVLRHAVLAVRLAGATSFGSERMLYYLGNVDNNLFPNINSDNPGALLRGFNYDIPIPRDGNFAYEALATNLRGFPMNIRNGNSYALINTELRVPIFKYLSQKPVLGNFWRNFQLVGFVDAGTAWQGVSPYRGDNPINIVTLQNPPTVFIKVKYFRDPLVAGFGGGVRMQIFGMYLRMDYARGIETRVLQKPMLHLAMGTDF